mgnify:CR=1 FL=1
MSISSAKSGGTGISLALDNNFMEPIASSTGGSSTIVFNDIPQGYKHLQIRMVGCRPIYQFASDLAESEVKVWETIFQ